MTRWDEMKGQYPPHMWYPLHGQTPSPPSSDMNLNTNNPLSPSEYSGYGVSERQIVAADIWPLLPAIVGTGASFLLLLMFNHKSWKSDNDETQNIDMLSPDETSYSESVVETRNPRLGSAVVVIYSIITTAGVSYYVFRVLTAANGHIISAFIPVSSAISVLILYFAAAYILEYHLVPESFTGDHIGNDIVTELTTFVYFSITTFATASMGDFAPVSNASRILVSLEVIFFIFIFTMGIVFFASP